MKLKIKVIFFILFSLSAIAREVGETEITTEDGIEVFQSEKYYLLKKNVKINSDKFILSADDVKIDFDKSLYDITNLEAKGNVNFDSLEFAIKGNGKKLYFVIQSEKLKIEGENSKLITENENIKMYSNGLIEVNNLSGNFSLKGKGSKLISDDIIIEAESIDGILTNIDDKKQISLLNVMDEKISFVQNKDTDMYAKKINFNYDTSIIELIDDVTIIRNGENIVGDYGTLDTKNNSYKIKSNNQNKVKVIIQNNE